MNIRQEKQEKEKEIEEDMTVEVRKRRMVRWNFILKKTRHVGIKTQHVEKKLDM